MVEVGWFDHEISSFVNFYLVNWTLVLNIFFWVWTFLHSDKMAGWNIHSWNQINLQSLLYSFSRDWLRKNYTKYTNNKKSTISLRFGWDFSSLTYQWADYFDQIWWGSDQNCEFLIDSIFFGRCNFFINQSLVGHLK